MKKSILFIVAVLLASSASLNAQDKQKQEQQMKEAAELQKKAEILQQESLKELEQELKLTQEEREKAMKDVKVYMDAARRDGNVRVYTPGSERTFNTGDPFVWTPGMNFNFHMGEDEERTSWDFSKSVKESTFSRDYVFDVEKSVNSVVMSVNGDCKSGEIKIKIIAPSGKTYSDITIDEFGNLNWRKTFTISETENKDKTGAWKFEISANKATGYFRISLQAS